jgi:hypothetical protein
MEEAAYNSGRGRGGYDGEKWKFHMKLAVQPEAHCEAMGLPALALTHARRWREEGVPLLSRLARTWCPKTQRRIKTSARRWKAGDSGECTMPDRKKFSIAEARIHL